MVKKIYEKLSIKPVGLLVGMSVSPPAESGGTEHSKNIELFTNITRSPFLLSRVLRDSTPRYVGPSVGWSIGRLVGQSPLYFFWLFELF